MAAKREKAKVRVADLRAATVDELVELHAKLAPFENDIKRREALRKLVRIWPEEDGAPAAESKAYCGAKGGIVTLGPAEEERKFKQGAMQAIYKALGLTRFLAGVSMTLKAAEALLGDRLAEYVYRERTGSRPITIVKTA